MSKTTIGVYCDKRIYSIVLKESGAINTGPLEKNDGRLRHFKFIKYLKSIDFDLCVIVENEESIPIINYLRREGKRPYLAIDFSPIPDPHNYRENPDLPTIVRKLDFLRKREDLFFSENQKELQTQIEQFGDGRKAIHMRMLNGFSLAFLAAVHGIFSLN